MDPEKPPQKPINEYVKYTSIGFEVLAYILIFVGGGYYLDKWLDTNPWFTLSLSLLGCGVAMYVIIKKLGNVK